MFAIKEKVYIVTETGKRKSGRIVSSPKFKDGEMTYLCEFGGMQTYVEHSKLNKLNFKVIDGGR